VKRVAEKAKIKKRVYQYLLRHSVATMLHKRGMPIEQIQKFLCHSKLETNQVYAECHALQDESGLRGLPALLSVPKIPSCG
jgi:site-specific recombinase XerD